MNDLVARVHDILLKFNQINLIVIAFFENMRYFVALTCIDALFC